MSRRRSLSTDEMALWRRVARSARPLHRKTPPFEEETEKPLPGLPRSPPAPYIAHRPPPSREPGHIDKPLLRRITKGRQRIDARLDLHGLRASEAMPRLQRFLETAQMRGAKVVLIITGKGSGPGNAGGVLRREVPLWLSQQPLRRLVVGFGVAERRHGGDGALYVQLRRPR